MSYEYERSVTYDFKKYKENKQIEFSANTKTQLDNFYCLIRDMDKAIILSNQGKLNEDKLSSLIADLSQQYASIRSEYIKPEVIAKYKYKQVAYTQEEIKTRIATDFCLKALEDTNNRVLWLSDTVDLLGQAIGSFEENNKLRELNYQLVCGTAITREKDGSFGRGGKGAISVSADKISSEADVVFASVETVVQEKNYESIANWLSKVQENGRIYCIYDEVHHIGAEKTENFLCKLFGVSDGKAILTNFALVGLTATVYRHDSPIKSFNRWFKDGYVHGQICKDDTNYGVGSDTYINNRIDVVSIKELTEAKLLMNPQIIRVDDFEEGIPETNDAARS